MVCQEFSLKKWTLILSNISSSLFPQSSKNAFIKELILTLKWRFFSFKATFIFFLKFLFQSCLKKISVRKCCVIYLICFWSFLLLLFVPCIFCQLHRIWKFLKKFYHFREKSAEIMCQFCFVILEYIPLNKIFLWKLAKIISNHE